LGSEHVGSNFRVRPIVKLGFVDAVVAVVVVAVNLPEDYDYETSNLES